MPRYRYFFTNSFYLVMYLALLIIAIGGPAFVLNTMETRVDTLYIHDTLYNTMFIHDTITVTDTFEVEYADNFVYLSAMTKEEEIEYHQYWDSVDGVYNEIK